MRDQDKEQQFDAEAYKKNLLSKSHGRVRITPSQEIISKYQPDKEEVDRLVKERDESVKRRFGLTNETGVQKQLKVSNGIPRTM